MPRRQSNLLTFAVRRDQLRHYADLISTEWRKATASIIAVAQTCSEANIKLSAEEKKQLMNQLPFGQAVFSKLAAIGSDARLRKPRLVKLLPPNYSTIYEVTHLSDSKLEQAVKEEILSPKATRSQITSFARGTLAPHRKVTKSAQSNVFYAEIKLSRGLGAEALISISKSLKEIERATGTEVIRCFETPAYNILVSRYEKQLTRHHHSVMKRLQGLVRELVKKRKRDAQRLGRNWGFASDEVDLNVQPKDLEQRIRSVLDTLGNGGDFDDLRAKAESLTDNTALDATFRKLEELFPYANSYDIELDPNSLKGAKKAESDRKRDFSKLKV